MKYLLIICLLFSCQKRLELKPVVNVSIHTEPYKTTVNGIYGDYWKITVSIDRKIDDDIKIEYYIKDVVRYDLYQSIPKGATSNAFTTQLRVNDKISDKGIIEITGSDKYQFNFTP